MSIYITNLQVEFLTEYPETFLRTDTCGPAWIEVFWNSLLHWYPHILSVCFFAQDCRHHDLSERYIEVVLTAGKALY